MCLILIASTYAASAAALVLLGGGSIVSVAGRVLVVSLLYLQVYRGHNWARLLVGAFTILVTVVVLLPAGLSAFASLRGAVLSTLFLVCGSAYLALFLLPVVRAQFNAVRGRRTAPAAL